MPFCQSCGSEHNESARFCPSCGQAVGDAAASAPGAAAPPPPPPGPIGTASTPASPLDAPSDPLGGPSLTPPGGDPMAPMEPATSTPVDRPASSMPPPAPLSVGGSVADEPDPPRSISGLGTALTVMFAIAAALSLAGFGLIISAIGNATDVRDGTLGAFGALQAADDGLAKVGGAGLMWGLVALPIFVLLIIWTFRAHRNLKAFGAQKPMLPTGMAIGSWFIPLFWYLGPYWCIADAYRGAAPDSDTNPGWRRAGSAGLVLAWWITFSLANVIYWVGNGIANSNAAEVSFRTDSDLSALEALVRNPDDYVTGWTVLAVSFFLSAVSAVLGALAIRAVSARQSERIQAMSGGAF